MTAPDDPPATQEQAIAVDPALLADLRLRLHGSLRQERAARAEARRLARELALARRLLRFFCGRAPSSAAAARAARLAEEIPRLRAAPLTEHALYHLDACQNHGAYTAVSGWAFRPAPEWDGRAAKVTLIFRRGASAYAAPAGKVPRADVAAHFAKEPKAVSGGARGLDGVGFACEVLNDSLPAGEDWEIVLRLECGALVCEQPTGRHLRL